MPKIKWEGDAASVEKATQAMRNKMKEYKDEVDKTAKSSRAFEQAAVRIKEAVNPTEAVKNKMKQLGDMVHRTKLTTEEAGAALGRFTDKVAKSTEAGKKRFKEQAQAVLEASQRQAELNAQGAKIKQSLELPIESYRRKLLELGKTFRAGAIDQATFVRGAKQLKEELNSAAPAAEKTFGDRALGNLQSMAAGYLSVGAAVGGVTAALRNVEEQSQKTADAVFNSLSSAGELQQLSENPAEFQKYLAESRNLVRRGIFPAEQQASAFDAVANLQNAGLNDADREVFFKAAERRQISPASLEGIGGRIRGIQDLFGQADTGSIAETFDKTLVTAKATLEDVAQTAEVLPKFGSEAKAVGVDFEHSSAAYVAVRKQTSNADRTADRLKAFFAQVDARGHNQGTLYKTVDFIQQSIAGGKTARDMLGDVNAVAGFRALSSEQGRKEFADQLKLINTADGTVNRQNFLAQDPQLRAAAFKASAGGQLAMTQGNLVAERELLFDSFLDARRSHMVSAAGGETMGVAWQSMMLGFNDFSGHENAAMQRAARTQRAGINVGLESVSVDAGGGKQISLLEAIEDHLRRSTAALEDINGKRISRRAVVRTTRPE